MSLYEWIPTWRPKQPAATIVKPSSQGSALFDANFTKEDFHAVVDAWWAKREAALTLSCQPPPISGED
jgi:hypothetical protein